MISSEVWNCCLGIIKLSIGIDTSAAIFGIMRFNETKELRFEIVGGAKQNPLLQEGGFLFVLFNIHYSSAKSGFILYFLYS